MEYPSIIVGMSRVKERNHIRLLEHGRGSGVGCRENALAYVEGLLPHKNINIYNAGFEKCNGVWSWGKSL